MAHEDASGLIYDSFSGVLALKLQQFALFRPIPAPIPYAFFLAGPLLFF